MQQTPTADRSAGTMRALPTTGLTFLRALWWLLVPLTICLTLVGIPARLRHLVGVGQSAGPVQVYELALELLLAAVYFAMAILIARRRSREPLALFLSLTLVLLGATETGMTDSLINPEFSTVWWLWRQPVLLMRALAMIGALLLFYLFPDGVFVPRWTRWLALAWATLTLLWLFLPELPLNTIHGPTWRRTPLASYLFATAWFATGFAAQVYRHRRVSGRVERQQTEWMAAGLTAALLGGVAYYGISAIDNALWPGFLGNAYSWLRPTLRVLLMALLPLCIAIAVLRYRLFDMEILVSGTLLYGALTAATVAIYVLVVTGLGRIVEVRNNLAVSLLATAAVAVLFQPLRVRLQRLINRLMYGERDDPYAVLTRLGRTFDDGSPSSETLMQAIVHTVADALQLPYAALQLSTPADGGVRATPNTRHGHAAFGTPPAPDRLYALPLIYQGEELGSLVVARRSAHERLNPADLRLLDDLARQAAIAVYAAQVSSNLHESRREIISAREEERRRLRRDLHDGLGPALAALAFRIDAARNMLTRDPQRADSQLAAAGDQLQLAIADIRRLVYGLRPPALEEWGLEGALRQHLAMVQPASVSLSLEVRQPLPPLPAAVEVAAYRIVQEAVNNALRHSGAHTCRAGLEVTEGALLATVEDDGSGLAPGAVAGVGLGAMRERAQELGGTLDLQSPAGGGLRVVARLPLHGA